LATHHAHPVAAGPERRDFGRGAWPFYSYGTLIGIIGLVLALVVGYLIDRSFRRFYFTYLVSYMFFLSLALGALFFVMLQHLTRAGWSVNIRRIAEAIAATMPILAVLSAPIFASAIFHDGSLYRWAQPAPPHVEHAAEHAEHPETAALAEEHGEHGFAHPSAHGVQPPDELTLAKRPMLNRWAFTARVIIYLLIWSILALWFWRQSTLQDVTGDVAHTVRMQTLAAPGLLLFGITVTFAAFDLLMSLDPHWFSTIFGIYYFSGAAVAFFATLVLILVTLQRLGYLTVSVSKEHYHDLGKWLFGFVFFWGYIAFSQFMLIWYASIPEEVGWYARRGATTVDGHISAWSYIAIVLLVGHLLIPFGLLMSRYMKRRRTLLAIGAAWVLVFHWLDLYWITVPELDGHVYFGILDVLTFLGLGGIFVATFVRFASKHSLRPINDPRVEESLAFQNI
jgi:hypothetical protein